MATHVAEVLDYFFGSIFAPHITWMGAMMDLFVPKRGQACFPLPLDYAPAAGEFDLRQLEVCFNLDRAVDIDDLFSGSGKTVVASWRAAYDQGLIAITSGLIDDGTAYATHDLCRIRVRVLTSFPCFGDPTEGANFSCFTLLELEEWAARCVLECQGFIHPFLANHVSELGDAEAHRTWYVLVTGLIFNKFKGGPHVTLDDTVDG